MKKQVKKYVVSHFGEIYNRANTFLNVRLSIVKEFPELPYEEATKIAKVYMRFLRKKRNHFIRSNEIFMMVSNDIKQNTGYDLIANFCYAFKKAHLSYLIPN
jgi:hypothetical protein